MRTGIFGLTTCLLVLLGSVFVDGALEVNGGRPLHRRVANEFTHPGEEHLEIRPLHRNNLLLSFNFETNHSTEVYPSSEILHYDVFPKSIGSVMQNSHTREWHLRFARGWYDSDVWGKLTRNGTENGGTGVELWAVIEAPSKEAAFENWLKLANSLSGLFCASLNFIDSSSTTTPVTLFQPDEAALNGVPLKNELYLFRSALPREPVCTENLTPFLKMLPTKGKAGIASLLTGKHVFNSEWVSMAIDVATACDDGNVDNCHLSMKQSIDLVKNVPRTLEFNKSPIPKPVDGDELRCDLTKKHDLYHCFPVPEENKLHFNLTDLFGSPIHGGSLMASEQTKVCTSFTNDWNVTMLSTEGVVKTSQDTPHCFPLDTNVDYTLIFDTEDSTSIPKLEAPPIYASRSLSGYSQDSGGFRVDLYNPTDDVEHIVVFETFPWFVRLYLHTLTLTVNDTTTYDVSDNAIKNLLSDIIYSPASDRKSPSHLELMAVIPSHTKVKLSFNFDKAMLLYAEYPPDANHGFEIDPAVIAVIDPATRQPWYEVRTTTALLTLPTPDFSMPYNVIILTSTVMSMAFGSFFNMLTKRTVTEDDAEAIAADSPLSKLKKKVQKAKAAVRAKLGLA